MAEKVNAFKSKYTGEQMEALLDKIKKGSNITTTGHPYERTQERYENDYMIITSNHVSSLPSGRAGGMVGDIIYNDNAGGITVTGVNNSRYTFNVTYEFKRKVLIKGVHFCGNSNFNYCNFFAFWFYYIDSETGASKRFYVSPTYSYSGPISFNKIFTEEIKTSKISVDCAFHGLLQYLAFDIELI